jgi:hypothetical protein
VKKVLFITLAAILALGVVLIGCGGETLPPSGPDKIKVGLVRDTDGVLAFYDQMSGGPVYRAFIKWVNDQGGIYMKTYAEKKEIEMVLREYDPMAPGDLTTQTTALLTQDKVHFMWGAPGTTTVYTQAAICNAYGIVLDTLEGGATDMIADPAKLPSWPYAFINLSFANWYQIPVLYKMLKAQNITVPKAYVVYIDNEHGHEYLEVTQEIFGAGNVIAAGHDQYAATADDIEDLIVAAKAALGDPAHPKYDIFCAFSYMPFLSYMVAAFDALDFNPPAIITGPGSSSGAFLLTFGDLMEGVTCFAVANTKTVITEPTTMTLTAMWDIIKPQAVGFPPDYTWDVWGHPCYWSGLEMWKQAVETVGHLDAGYSAEVRDVLASFTKEHPAKTVMGNCWYRVFGDGLGGGVMDYEAEPGQIGQWQNGYVEVVGYNGITNLIPKYAVTATFKYPMTGKWGWLPKS